MQRFTCILSLLATGRDDGNMPRIHKCLAVGHFMKVKHNLAVQLAEEKVSALSEIKVEQQKVCRLKEKVSLFCELIKLNTLKA